MKILTSGPYFFLCLFILLQTELKSQSISVDQKVLNYQKLVKQHKSTNAELAKMYADSMLFYVNQTTNDSLATVGIFDYGSFLLMKGESSQSIPHLDKSRELATLRKDTSMIVNSINNLAIAHYRLGAYDKSLELLGQIENTINLSTNKLRQVMVSNLRGLVYKAMGNYDAALASFKQILVAIDKDPDYANQKLTALDNLASISIAQEDYLSAKETLLEVLMLKNDRLPSLVKLSTVYYRLNQIDSSEQIMAKAISLAEKSNMTYALAALYNNSGIRKNESGDYVEALSLLRKAYDYGKESGAVKFLLVTYEEMAKAYEGLNDPSLALENFKKYYLLKDSVDSKALKERVEELQTKYDVEQKERQIEFLEAEKVIATLEMESIKKNNALILVVAIFLLAILLISVSFYLTIRKSKKELEQLNAKKDKFFAIIAHDLRNEISALTGFDVIIKSYLDQGNYTKVEQLSEAINKQSEQLSHLLDNLLKWAFSQLNTVPYHPSKIRLLELITGLKDQFKRLAASKNITINISIGEDVCLFADPDSIQLIFRNLIVNAIKFSNDGVITVVAKGVDSCWEIIVEDQGIGMTQEQVSSLFDIQKSQTHKGTRGELGSGLGLYLVKEYVLINNGRISVNSELDKGTAIGVLLPKCIK
jgi:signal transduction histidine kinase